MFFLSLTGLKSQKQKQKQTHRSREQNRWVITRGDVGWEYAKGVNCMVTDSNSTFNGDYLEVHTDVEL